MRHVAVAAEVGVLPTGLGSACVRRGPVCVRGQMGSVAEAEPASLWAVGDCAQLVSLTGDSRKMRCLEAKGDVPSPAERCRCPLLEAEGGAGFAERVGWGRNDSLGTARPSSQLQLPVSEVLPQTTDADSAALCPVVPKDVQRRVPAAPDPPAPSREWERTCSVPLQRTETLCKQSRRNY